MSINKKESHEWMEYEAGNIDDLITDEDLISDLSDLHDKIDSFRYNWKNEYDELGLKEVLYKLDEMLAKTKLD